MTAAIDTIAELGYGQASLARIAERAGTSKGVILYYFSGKDDLIKELVAGLVGTAGEYMRPRVEAESTGAGMLRAYIEANLTFMRENRNLVVAAVQIALNARGADGSPLGRVQGSATAQLQQLLAHFQGTGEFRASFDPLVMAMAIRAAIDAVPPQLARDDRVRRRPPWPRTSGPVPDRHRARASHPRAGYHYAVSGGVMKPYFDTNHAAGLLLLLVTLAWAVLELAAFARGLNARKGATKVGGRSWRVFAWTCVVAANVLLYLAPRALDPGGRDPARRRRLRRWPGDPADRSWPCAGGPSRPWASTSPSPSWSVPTSRWSPPACTACCGTRVTPESSCLHG